MRLKLAFIGLLVLASVFLTGYFHFALRKETMYSHIFYIPVILAVLWWQRRGLIVPAVIGLSILFSHLLTLGARQLPEELVRAGMLMVAGVIVAELSVRLRQAELSQMEQALRLSEERYRTLFDVSPVAMAKVGRDGRFTLVNRRFCELTGYLESELTGVLTIDQVWPQEGPAVIEEGLAGAGPEALRVQEALIRRKDGRTRFAEVSQERVPGSAETIFILADITERRATEIRLRENEGKYRMLIEAFPHTIALVQDRRLAFVNPAGLAAFGYTDLEEVLGSEALTWVAERERARIRGFMEARERGDPDAPEQYYTVFRRRDGSEFVAQVLVRSITYGGRPAFQLIVLDVTEQKEAEEALRRSEREKQLILNSIGEHVVYYNQDFCIVWANKAAADSLGLTPPDLVGRRCYELWHGRSEPCADCAVLKALRTGEPHRFEIQSPDGRYWVIRGYPVKDSFGRTLGAVEFTQEVTERRRADEALRQAEELYRVTIEATTDVVFLRDRAGKYVQFNESSLRPLGLSREEVVGKTAAELRMLPLENRVFYDQMHRRVVESGEPIRYEDKLLLRDRTLVTDTQLWPVKDREGKVVYVAGFGRDITDRKLAEDALRRSEERYRSLVEETQEPISLIQDFKHVYVNPAYCRLLGYGSPEELLGRPLEVTIAPADRELVRDRYRRRLAGEAVPSRYELRLQRKDGSIIWVEVSVQLREFQGQPAVQSASHDITERKLAEEALRESEERFRQVAESAQEWIWEVDANGLYTYASPAVERILGYRPDELVGKQRFYDLFQPRERARLKREALEVFAARQSFRDFVNLNLHKDGREVWLSSSGVPLLDAAGGLRGYRGVDVDISERVRLEQRLSEVESRLAALVKRLPGAVFYQTGGGREFISENIRELLGYPAEELTKDRSAFPQLIHPDDRERLKAEVTAWHTAGEPGVLVLRFRARRADGAYVWLEDYMIEVKPKKGKKYMTGVMLASKERAQEAEEEA